MAKGSTLFLLKSELQGAFDGSSKGVAVSQSPNLKVLGNGEGIQFEKGFVELARHRELDALQSFTIEATIMPTAVGDARHNIAEAQSPAVAFFIESNGRLVGSVHTARGWVGVDSGRTLVKAKTESRVGFMRDENGKTDVLINGKVVGSKVVAGPIKAVGPLGFKIGSGIDGRNFLFSGTIADVQIRQDAVDSKFFAKKIEAARRIEEIFKSKTGLSKVVVQTIPDYGNSRLQPIKDIMNAAGVQKLSDLQTLRVNVPTVMTPGKVLVAARRSAGGEIKWSQVASQYSSANVAAKREILARNLTNRNSVSLISKDQEPPAGGTDAVREVSSSLTGLRATLSSSRLAPISTAGRLTEVTARQPVVMRTAGAMEAAPTLRMSAEYARVDELFELTEGALKLRDRSTLSDLASDEPAAWAGTSTPIYKVIAPKTIPVNSAVMIGHTIDLTNTELVIEPSVSTLYLIADRLICGANAKITWRRPGGTTPARQDNPDLNGRSWSGVHTHHDSRHGLDGGDGRAGETGLSAAHGLHSPNLEIWVKDMSAMPNIDLNGEDGIKAGRGQRGGRGGNGADGQVGERVWIFGWICTADPGDGGDGGNGGSGGRGGRGGNGGHGGKITIAVLEDTLESTVTSRSFKIKNQGGQRGRGGDGGPGGAGGRGGRSGVGETCKDASSGHNGALGQPGQVGLDGTNLGSDGEVSFYEFSIEEWDALLTRPWLSEVSPVRAFPGDRLTLRGSRFTAGDRVVLAGFNLAPTVNADESISVTIPLTISGGQTSVFVRRQDGTESNRYNLWIKPQLDPFSGLLNPGAKVTLRGRAFVNGASVLVNGSGNPATVRNATQLEFTMPGTGGSGSSGGAVSLQVRNPDGFVSNSRTATIPRILEIPFQYGIHNLPFANFTDGVPDWGTFEDTFGAAEVWHEQLDPVFGHPILTAAFYGFYQHFLKGKANGGLATGFCTSLASLVADKFWQGHTDTHTVTKGSVHKFLTAVHGRLLSRESLIHFHDQGREGIARVERSCREIEATFLRGCDRSNAPLLFFIPSGAIWDSGYIDELSDSHCVMPYRFAYPQGHPGPQLSPDGSTTISGLDGVEMYVWDCNKPTSPNCRLVFSMNDGQLEFQYFADSSSAKFRSQDGVTLGMMTNGSYYHADHDLPFSGPLGLTTFVIDFLLSPADLQVTDANGLRTGNFGGQLLSEIPDSRPCYLLPGAYMLPTDMPLTRRIVGTGAGSYTFNSIMPSGGSLVLQDVATSAGQTDVLAVSADGTQLRFTPAAEKNFHLVLARQVGNEARAVAIRGAGGGPAAEIDVTISPELSLTRVGNRGGARNVEVRAFAIDRPTNTPVNRTFSAVNLPSNHDLTVAVQNWSTLDASVETVSFE